LPSAPQQAHGKANLRYGIERGRGHMGARAIFAECPAVNTRQNTVLPCALCGALGKGYLLSVFVLPSVFFITHGILLVCRVREMLHSANPLTLGNNVVSGSESSQVYRELIGFIPPEFYWQRMRHKRSLLV